MQAEGSFMQQRSSYDELSSQARELMIQRDKFSRDLQQSKYSLTVAEGSLEQQSNLIANLRSEVSENHQEAQQWVQVLGDTQQASTVARRANDNLEVQVVELKRSNFDLAQVQAMYNETKTILNRSQQEEQKLRQQLVAARQEIQVLTEKNQKLTLQLSQSMQAGTPERPHVVPAHGSVAQRTCPKCPQKEIEMEGMKKEVQELLERIHQKDKYLKMIDEELDEKLAEVERLQSQNESYWDTI